MTDIPPTQDNPDDCWPNTPEAGHYQRRWFQLKIVTRLLGKRQDELSVIEFNGLLRLPLRLRQAIIAESATWHTLDLKCEAMRKIDTVLDRACLKPPATPPTEKAWQQLVSKGRA